MTPYIVPFFQCAPKKILIEMCFLRASSPDGAGCKTRLESVTKGLVCYYTIDLVSLSFKYYALLVCSM